MFAAKNVTGESLVPGHPIFPSDMPGQDPDIIYTKNEITHHARVKKRKQIADEDEVNGLIPGVRIEVTAEMEDLVAELERIVAKRETLQKIEAALQSSVSLMSQQLGRDADDMINSLREQNEGLRAEVESKNAALANISNEEDEKAYLDGEEYNKDESAESKAEEVAEEAAERRAEEEAVEEKAEADAEDRAETAGESGAESEAEAEIAEEAAEEEGARR
jgi:hypothetical protein